MSAVSCSLFVVVCWFCCVLIGVCRVLAVFVCSLSVAGRWLLLVGGRCCRWSLLVVCCFVFMIVDCPLAAVCCWCWSLETGCWLLAVGCVIWSVVCCLWIVVCCLFFVGCVLAVA